MKGYIYKYTFPDNKVYIGQTRRNPKIRHREHLDPVTGPYTPGFWEAYQKFNTFKYEIVHEIQHEDELVRILNALESMLIYELKAYDSAYGYNKQIFGHERTNSNRILSQKFEEVFHHLTYKQKILHSSICTKIWETKESFTAEERDMLQKCCSNDDPMFHFHEGFDIDSLVREDIEDNWFQIERVLNFLLMEIEDEAYNEARCFVNENADAILSNYYDSKTIVALDKDGNIVKEFLSYNEIADYFNVTRSDNVRNVIRGKQKTAYGYFWKMKSDIKIGIDIHVD